MVFVVVGDEQPVQLIQGDAQSFQALGDAAAAQPGIEQEPAVPEFQNGCIPLASRPEKGHGDHGQQPGHGFRFIDTGEYAPFSPIFPVSSELFRSQGVSSPRSFLKLRGTAFKISVMLIASAPSSPRAASAASEWINTPTIAA